MSSGAHLMSAGSEEVFLGKGKAPGMQSNRDILAAVRHIGEPHCKSSLADHAEAVAGELALPHRFPPTHASMT